jgi:hypothetical protein
MVSGRGILGIVTCHTPRRSARASGLAILGLALWATGPAVAIDAHLGADAIDRAITFARQATRDERRAFHAGYFRMPGDAVRRISVVSEYRRVVLLVEEKMRLLDRNYGVRQMSEALRPWRGLVEVIVELQFHPQNNYVGVPLIDVLLVPLDGPGTPMPLVPEGTDRRPRFGLFWDPAPMDAPWWPFPPPSVPVITGSEPLTGGWLHARFDARPLARGRYEIVVKDGGTTLGTGTFDLGSLR